MLPLLLAVACTVPVPDLARPSSSDPATTDPASPPPARGPSEEKLYQELYAGEIGEAAFARGQRARLVVFLAAMEFTPEQLRGLGNLARDVAAEARVVREAREEVGRRELEALSPVYAALETRLAQLEPLTEEEGAVFAERLAAARASAYGEEDPRAAHYVRVRTLLARVRPWMAMLSAAQRTRLGESRFVLGRRLGPFVNPGDYGDLVGTMWDGGDFGSLRATQRGADESHLDLGGLWSVERMQAGPNRRLEGFQLEALVLFTAMESELPAAVAIRLGEAPPDAGDGGAVGADVGLGAGASADAPKGAAAAPPAAPPPPR